MGQHDQKRPLDCPAVVVASGSPRLRAILNRRSLAAATFEDAELGREVVELFIGQLPDLLTGLQTAREPAAWYGVTHALRGSAATIGAERLVDVCRDAETLLRWPDPKLPRHCAWQQLEATELGVQRQDCIAALDTAIAEFIEEWHRVAGAAALTVAPTAA